jgi:hypothetical protein
MHQAPTFKSGNQAGRPPPATSVLLLAAATGDCRCCKGHRQLSSQSHPCCCLLVHKEYGFGGPAVVKTDDAEVNALTVANGGIDATTAKVFGFMHRLNTSRGMDDKIALSK